MSAPIFWGGRDVHKDSVTAAVSRNRDTEPLRVDRLPNNVSKLRRYFKRLSAEGSVRACYTRPPALDMCFGGPSPSGASTASWPPLPSSPGGPGTVASTTAETPAGPGPLGRAPRLEVPASPLQGLPPARSQEPDQVAATAVARELIGFIWAVLQDHELYQWPHPEVNHAV